MFVATLHQGTSKGKQNPLKKHRKSTYNIYRENITRPTPATDRQVRAELMYSIFYKQPQKKKKKVNTAVSSLNNNEGKICADGLNC